MKKRIGYAHRTGVMLGAAILALAVGLGAIPAKADSLYIGDISDNTVKRFDAKTGAYLGTFVASGSGIGQAPELELIQEYRLRSAQAWSNPRGWPWTGNQSYCHYI